MTGCPPASPACGLALRTESTTILAGFFSLDPDAEEAIFVGAGPRPKWAALPLTRLSSVPRLTVDHLTPGLTIECAVVDRVIHSFRIVHFPLEAVGRISVQEAIVVAVDDVSKKESGQSLLLDNVCLFFRLAEWPTWCARSQPCRFSPSSGQMRTPPNGPTQSFDPISAFCRFGDWYCAEKEVSVLAEYQGSDGVTVDQLSVGERVLADIECVPKSSYPGAERGWRVTALRREAGAAAVPRPPRRHDRDDVALKIVSTLFQAPYDLYVIAEVVCLLLRPGWGPRLHLDLRRWTGTRRGASCMWPCQIPSQGAPNRYLDHFLRSKCKLIFSLVRPKTGWWPSILAWSSKPYWLAARDPSGAISILSLLIPP